MHKRLFLIFVFITTTLIQTQLATADFLIANGSATEDAWVIYSTWRNADNDWPAGFRTQGWRKIEPGGFTNLPVPSDNPYVYIRVEDPYGNEIKPLDHATRDSYSFWMHPTKIFTVVETAEGEFLDSDLNQASLETATLYEYTEGIHIITKRTECEPSGPPDLPAQQIYDQAIHSVVLIYIRGVGHGSGVLIDKDRKLVVTNQHVIDNAEWASVFFPYRDRNEIVRKNLSFYQKNQEWLIRNNYATIGRIIAQNMQNDLAIVQLDSLPSTAREIQHDFSQNVEVSMKRGDKVHILGNPGSIPETRLWNWTQGTFLGPQNTCPVEDGELVGCLVMEGDTHGGNSGGPVLNGQGVLIGIHSAGDGETVSLAATTRNIKALLDTVRPRHTFRIKNNAGFTVSYLIKWSDNRDWSRYSLDSGRSRFHWSSEEVRPTGYPKIAFDGIVNDDEVTWRIDPLNTFLRYFGNNYKDHITSDDAEKYVFEYNQWNRRLDLNFDENAAAPMLSSGQGIQGEERLQETALLPNYPNPFNPETWIPYKLSKPAEVIVTIYASDGQLIRTLVLGHRSMGTYQSKSRAAYWDGKNESGEKVASGVYFYTLTAGDFSATRKMLILK